VFAERSTIPVPNGGARSGAPVMPTKGDPRR
jgi:hypothetical protein